jgi:hypothetical protein
MGFHKNWKRCDLIRSLNCTKAFPFQLNVRSGVVTEKLRFPYNEDKEAYFYHRLC